jgi:putative transposase
MGKRLFWLSDKQWARIKPYLPTDVRGVEWTTAASSAAVHVLKSGCRWCDCPEAYGPSTTFRQLAANGRSADMQRTMHSQMPNHASLPSC